MADSQDVAAAANLATRPDAPVVPFDSKAMEAMVQGAVRSTLDQYVKDAEAKRAEEPAPKPATEPAEGGPYAELFKPALEPVLKSAKSAEVAASMAMDAVNFYQDPENQEALPYRGKIEGVISGQLKKEIGRASCRERV